MGAGKTVIALTAAAELLADGRLGRVLLIGTKKVCQTVWAQEADKWEHLYHLKIGLALGAPSARKKAIDSASDIVCINFENVAWFFSEYRKQHSFDGLVIDETSKFRDPGGVAFKKMRRYLKPFWWRVGLTGTPVSEDFLGLYGQALMLDDGAAYGCRYDDFKTAYFYPLDYEQRQWAVREGCQGALLDRLDKILHVIPDYRDELPPISYVYERVELPADEREIYETFKRDLIIDVDGEKIIAQNMAVLYGKLAQLASGFIYLPEGDETILLHDAKHKAACAWIDGLGVNTGLIVYQYEEELTRLQERFPAMVVLRSGEGLEAVTEAWNAGEIGLLALHPKSAGHGLNLMGGGRRILWIGPPWSRDLWEQTNARLWRTGQTEPVEVTVIIAANTVDELIEARLEGKAAFDAAFHDHVKG